MSRRSVVWDYFTKIDLMQAKCNTCKKIFKSDSSTSGLTKHLKNAQVSVSLDDGILYSEGEQSGSTRKKVKQRKRSANSDCSETLSSADANEEQDIIVVQRKEQERPTTMSADNQRCEPAKKRKQNEIIHEWGLENNVSAIVDDNAATAFMRFP